MKFLSDKETDRVLGIHIIVRGACSACGHGVLSRVPPSLIPPAGPHILVAAVVHIPMLLCCIASIVGQGSNAGEMIAEGVLGMVLSDSAECE